MALLDQNSTLEDVLKSTANTNEQGITQDYAKKRRQLVAQQAAAGRLGSNVAEYPLSELDTSEASALAHNQAGLETALGGIPAEDYLNQQENDRKLRLAKLIAEQNKPGALQEALGGLGTAAGIAGTFAAFM